MGHMSIDLPAPRALPGDARLRHQRARIEQRHQQFGRHCRLDVAGLLLRVDHGRGTQAKAADVAIALVRSRSGTAVPATATCLRVPGPVTLGDLVAVHRPRAFAHREWVATLADLTTVVVSDGCGSPSALGLEKAVSIVQSRAYLENRARRLLRPFGQEDGSWRLATIDFGAQARRLGCEFLMGFSLRVCDRVLPVASSAVEVGFALPSPAAVDPVFVLTVVTIAGSPT